MAQHEEDQMAPLPNGSLLESHELRIQRVEAQTDSLIAITSSSAAKLEGIASTLVAIDGKMDVHMDALEAHKKEDQETVLRVHDLEQTQASKDKKTSNLSYAFYTAVAAIAADIVLKGFEHLPKLLALFK